MSNACWLFRIAAVAIAGLCAPGLFGQASATEDGEVSVYGGGTFGMGSHPLVGGSSGFGFSRHGMAFLEGSYSPMGRDILWHRHDVQSPQESHLFDFMFSTHIRFPIRERWAPYGLIGGGLAFNTFRAYAGPQGALIRIDDFKMAFQTGGGLRYYFGENWGIRPEFKVIVSSRTFTRVAIGVFYNSAAELALAAGRRSHYGGELPYTLFWRLTIALAMSLPAAAQWKALGPFGGPASIVQTDPNSPRALLAGTNNALLFRSSDAGESWEVLPFPLQLRAVLHCVAIPPRIRDLYLAGVSPPDARTSGLWRSSDAGVTWAPVDAFKGLEVWSIAVFRGDPLLMAAGTDAGVFRSTDGGLSWERISPPENRELQPVVSVTFDAKRPSVLYAGTPHLPWKTTDGGASWHSVHQGMMDDSDIFSIVVDRNQPLRVLAAACSGIYRTLNGGGRWAKPPQSKDASHRTYIVAQDPQFENVFFAGTTYGTMRSPDGGTTWRRISPYTTRSISFDLGQLGRIFIATDQAGILRTDNNGETWQPANRGFSNRHLIALTEDAGGVVYTGAAAEGADAPLFMLPSDGAEWETRSMPLAPVVALAASASTPATLYAAGTGTAFLSKDAGKSWTAVTAPFNDTPTTLIAPGTESHLVLAATGSSVFVSGDSGETWSERQFPASIRSLFALDAPWIAALTDSEIYVSVDGANWERYGRVPDDSEIRGIAASPNRLFVATTTGLRVSDASQLLQLVPGLPPGATVQAICRHPSREGVLFAASYNAIFASADSGMTWRKITMDGWPGATVKQMIVARGNPDRLLMLTPQQGVFALTLDLDQSGPNRASKHTGGKR